MHYSTKWNQGGLNAAALWNSQQSFVISIWSSKQRSGVQPKSYMPVWYLEEGYQPRVFAPADVKSMSLSEVEALSAGAQTSVAQRHALQIGLHEVVRKGVQGAVCEFGVYQG
eukprot:gnl/TRDRNA2_/TRDRNA2_138694_c0_seq1.p1 gnl/TRDRNA2_/TRDRNA2_138694_c0~~gnl/TRDRNA2_/TRDRNA2_138694_c0_seq1.p1  ORF type:complete len:112 (+),score=14.53 gnl/TRDRNA2_/TRDRNA2_138694_c0_seq1:96-431(+)